VLVTHDMEWVEEYCNRALLLEHGRVILEGAPNEVVKLHLDRTAAEAEARRVAALAAGLDPAVAARGGGRR